MKMTAFNATCPYEIGDKVQVLKQVLGSHMVEVAVITDIACTHFVRTGNIEFTFELNNSGEYIPLVSAKEAGYPVPEIPPLPCGGKV